MRMFTQILERSPIVLWRSIFEHARRMKGVLIRVLHVVSDGLTAEYCIAAHLYSVQVCRLRRKSGLLFTALYLKQCIVVLQKYYGEGSFSPELLSPFVSLTRSGLPRIIPAFHRKIISKRDSRADRCVKVYISWFSLCRAVMLAPSVSKETFKSLVDVVPRPRRLITSVCKLHLDVDTVLKRYLPDLHKIPLHQGISWAPTWKSTPTRSVDKTKQSIYMTLVAEIKNYVWLQDERNVVKPNPFSTSLFHLVEPRIVFAYDKDDLDLEEYHPDGVPERLNILYEDFKKGRQMPNPHLFLPPGFSAPVFSRVAASMAGAGKRRLFIIGNYGVQRVLRPYHDWFMTVLRSLPSDGTYDQLKPIAQVIGSPFVASYDLRSATDRWPRPFLVLVLSSVFGFKRAVRLVEEGLGYMPVTVSKPLVKSPSIIRFHIGTPLGFFAAWPIFALSHHILVWLAAEYVYPGRTFRSYGILGDDLVIADRKVAKRYTKLLSDLQVEISHSKSLISERGAFEFAKKFFIIGLDGRPYDASPISIRSLLLSRTTLGLSTIRKMYSVSLKSTLRLAGAGYRVMARLSPSYVKGRWARLIVFLSYDPGFTEELLMWWLTGWKHPINPYIKGRLRLWLLGKVAFKQLKLPNLSDFPDQSGGEQVLELAEYTITKCWLLQWLTHVHWYANQISDCQGTLSCLLKAPTVEISWLRRPVDPTIHRYGLVWRLYDEAANTTPSGILASAIRRHAVEPLQYPVFWRFRVSVAAHELPSGL